jgi:hypothetical protein
MEEPTFCGDLKDRNNPHFSEYIELFRSIDDTELLFPKPCRACGRNFGSISDYIGYTSPKGHSIEDASSVMQKPFTMMYRHCACGNTLVLTFTEAIFPQLGDFWSMVEQEAEETGKTVQEVVQEFMEQWERTVRCGL